MSEIKNTRDRVFARIVHYLLMPVVFSAGLFRDKASGSIDRNKTKRVLVIRLDNAGDLVMLTPLVGALKREIFPGAEIDVLTDPRAAGILANNPHIARVIPFCRSMHALRSLRNRRYDLIIEPRGDIRAALLAYLAGAPRRVGFDRTGGGYMLTDIVPFVSGRHRVDQNMAVARFLYPDVSAGAPPELFETDVGRGEANKLMASLRRVSDRPIALIFPFSAHASKEWGVERYAGVASRVVDELGLMGVVAGSSAESARCDAVCAASGGKAVSAAGALSLEGLISFVRLCSVVIANDSAPAHVAAAAGVPVVALFGPMDPAIAGPRHLRPAAMRILYKKMPCSFCNSIKVLPRRCRGRAVPECLDGITVDEVVLAVKEVCKL